jgi:Tfp pilus assembly protein PilZ
MTDPATAARRAREKLAQGLGALQSATVPPDLIDAADPVAEAMSALWGIESSGGAQLAQAGPVALDAARRALARLQAYAQADPAVERALDAVAESLSLIFAVMREAPVQAAAAPAPAQAPRPPPAPAPATFEGRPSSPPGLGVPQHVAMVSSPPRPPAQGAWMPPAAPAAPRAPAFAPTALAQQPGPVEAPRPVAEPPRQAPAAVRPEAVPPTRPAQPAPVAPPSPAQDRAGRTGGPVVRIEVDLGAHSSSNFYKGLSGHDVIDSGGIFVATYQVPALGQAVLLKVSLPGGYEFEARGVVRWTRDARAASADAPPGFGAQLTDISPEGRQLVYRYVRNREPLFHDDL